MKIPEYLEYTQDQTTAMLKTIRDRYAATVTPSDVADLHMTAPSDLGTTLMIINELEDHCADLQTSLDVTEAKLDASEKQAKENWDLYRRRTEEMARYIARLLQAEQWLNDALVEIRELKGRAA